MIIGEIRLRDRLLIILHLLVLIEMKVYHGLKRNCSFGDLKLE